MKGKVRVQLYVPTGRKTAHGFPITKPVTVTRQLREDEDGFPFIQYAGFKVYVRPAKFLYAHYEECDRDEANI